MYENYRVALVDDNAFVRKGLISILEKYPEFQITGELGDGFTLLKELQKGIEPDILILDPFFAGCKRLNLPS